MIEKWQAKKKTLKRYSVNINIKKCGTVFDNVNDNSSEVNKKQKVDHIADSSNTWENNKREAVRQHLEISINHSFIANLSRNYLRGKKLIFLRWFLKKVRLIIFFGPSKTDSGSSKPNKTYNVSVYHC